MDWQTHLTSKPLLGLKYIHKNILTRLITRQAVYESHRIPEVSIGMLKAGLTIKTQYVHILYA